MASSKAERQILGAACGVAINQRSESNLVSNSSTGEPFGHDADHDSKHCSPAIEEFNSLELLHVDVAGCSTLEPRVAGLTWLHCEIELMLRIINQFPVIPALVIVSP